MTGFAWRNQQISTLLGELWLFLITNFLRDCGPLKHIFSFSVVPVITIKVNIYLFFNWEQTWLLDVLLLNWGMFSFTFQLLLPIVYSQEIYNFSGNLSVTKWLIDVKYMILWLQITKFLVGSRILQFFFSFFKLFF